MDLFINTDSDRQQMANQAAFDMADRIVVGLDPKAQELLADEIKATDFGAPVLLELEEIAKNQKCDVLATALKVLRNDQ